MTDSTSEFDEKMVLKMENQAANSQGQASFIGGDGKKITLLSLHDDVFQEILSHLSYYEIAKLRLVRKKFFVDLVIIFSYLFDCITLGWASL